MILVCTSDWFLGHLTTLFQLQRLYAVKCDRKIIMYGE